MVVCGGWLQLGTEGVTLHASTWQAQTTAGSQHEISDNRAGSVNKDNMCLFKQETIACICLAY